MTFASTDTLRRQLRRTIRPFRDANLRHGAYELRLGAEVVSTASGEVTVLAPPPDDAQLGGHVDILPGQLAMLMTEESVHIPSTHLALISIRAGAKFAGLVNVSGFHVDPGFEGRLKFTVYNAGSLPVPLRRGQKLFMIWLAKFDSEVSDPYSGNHDGQAQIEPKDIRHFKGELASPAALAARIQATGQASEGRDATLSADLSSLKGELGALRTAVYAVAALLVINMLVFALRVVFAPDPPAYAATTVVYPGSANTADVTAAPPLSVADSSSVDSP